VKSNDCSKTLFGNNLLQKYLPHRKLLKRLCVLYIDIGCNCISFFDMNQQILILGSTGRTGQWLLTEALSRGFRVSVLVRDKSKVKPQQNLTIFEGSPYSYPDLEVAATNCNIVLSALNVSRTNDFPWASLRTPANFLSQTMRNIIQLNQKLAIDKMIFVSAWGVAETINDIPFWFRWLIQSSNIGVAYRDHEIQEQLAQQSGMNYMAVRPVGLTDSTENQLIKVTLANNKPKPSLTISRRTVAKFMLDNLDKTMYFNQKPIISKV
jgi:putative NADH-flavin reductase